MINMNLRINWMVERGPPGLQLVRNGVGIFDERKWGERTEFFLTNKTIKISISIFQTDKNFRTGWWNPTPPISPPCCAPILKPICRLTNDFDGPRDKMFFKNNLFFFIAERESLPTKLNVILPDFNVAKKQSLTQSATSFISKDRSWNW